MSLTPDNGKTSMTPVVFIMPTGDFRGGAERMLRNVAVGLDARHVPAAYIFLSDGPLYQELTELGLDVRLVSAGRVRQLHRYIGALQRIYREIKQISPCIVIDWMTKGHMYGGVVATLLGRPTGVWLHDFVGRSFIERLSRTLPTHKVWASSQAIANTAIGFNLHPTVVHPGVDTLAFKRIGTARERLRTVIGIPEPTFAIGTVARLVRWKGIDVAIRAISILPDETHLIVVGGEHFSELEYPDELKRLSRGLGVESRIHFVGHQTNVEEWMNCFDVFVHLTTRPNPADQVIKEAMACGCPVVATRSGYTTEVIQDKVNGLLVEQAEPGIIASAIESLLLDPEQRRSLSRSGEETIRQSFSIEAMVDNFVRSLPETAG